MTTILIANRGEIACRIIRTARAQGLRTVAVYSEADAGAPHVALADHAVLIGPAAAADSYLNADRILAAARASGAQMIHPGYGFLSENADFARAVADAGLIFVGPPAAAIGAMGNKAEAKRLMAAAGVPCVPGYAGEDQSDTGLAEQALAIGLPVMIKAAAGGGGRGMRLVTQPAQLNEAITLARSEALNAFGSGELILEKAITNARHVEVQVFADAYGAVIHLGERDCSVQRRHQKVVEEAPCPVMKEDLRDRMGRAAVAAARAVDYRGAGTVEFLLQEDGRFYFLEMNTRLQVEHPVTELVTGLDLVALQLAIAVGETLPLTQEEVVLSGHAIEVRLYTEDPARDYLPDIGRIDLWHPAEAEGIRVDAGIRTGQQVSPHYDAMQAKIIAHGPSREVARSRLVQAVQDTVLLGVKTNSQFLSALLQTPDFVAGKATTALLDQVFADGFKPEDITSAELALAAALLARQAQQQAFQAAGHVSRGLLGWSSAPLPATQMFLQVEETRQEVQVACRGDVWTISVGGESFALRLGEVQDGLCRVQRDGQAFDCRVALSPDRVSLAIAARRLDVRHIRPGRAADTATSDGRVRAPMPGVVQQLLVAKGQTIVKGDTLAVLEAMKMQHQLRAPVDGTIGRILVQPGQQVPAGAVLLEFSDPES